MRPAFPVWICTLLLIAPALAQSPGPAVEAPAEAESTLEEAPQAIPSAIPDVSPDVAGPDTRPPSDRRTEQGAVAPPSRLAEDDHDEDDHDQDDKGPGWGEHLVLGGHRFLVGAFVPSAIPASYLGVRAGLQYHQVPGFAQLPTLAGTSAQAVVLETLNVGENIDFAIRLHDLFTLFGDGYGRARVGANIETLLGTGADYTYGGDVGLLVNVLRIRGFVLSARAQIGGYGGQSAGIVGLFQDLNAIAEDAVAKVLDNPQTNIDSALAQLNNSFRVATAALLTPFSGLTYGGSLNAAVGLGPFLGLQATVGLTYDAVVYRPTRFDVAASQALTTRYQVDSLRPNFGAALDLDLSSIYVPLAFMFEYVATPVQVEASGDLEGTLEGSFEQLLALGVYYSGRTDLQLGLIAFSLVGQTPALGADQSLSDNPVDLGAQFVFRYIW